jgi:hypothetical protein
MIRRRSTPHVASHNGEVSAFDRVTWNAFMLAVTVSVGVVLGYGPAAALHHIADAMVDVLARARDFPVPDAAAWSGQMVF